jgi:hypothetical protein
MSSPPVTCDNYIVLLYDEEDSLLHQLDAFLRRQAVYCVVRLHLTDMLHVMERHEKNVHTFLDPYAAKHRLPPKPTSVVDLVHSCLCHGNAIVVNLCNGYHLYHHDVSMRLRLFLLRRYNHILVNGALFHATMQDRLAAFDLFHRQQTSSSSALLPHCMFVFESLTYLPALLQRLRAHPNANSYALTLRRLYRDATYDLCFDRVSDMDAWYRERQQQPHFFHTAASKNKGYYLLQCFEGATYFRTLYRFYYVFDSNRSQYVLSQIVAYEHNSKHVRHVAQPESDIPYRHANVSTEELDNFVKTSQGVLHSLHLDFASIDARLDANGNLCFSGMDTLPKSYSDDWLDYVFRRVCQVQQCCKKDDLLE